MTSIDRVSATDSSSASDVHAVYFDADTPADLFAAAAQWATENDGGFSIEAVAWIDLRNSNTAGERNFELAIYYQH